MTPAPPERAPARTTVWATVALPGFHRWPEAPESRGYLARTHRHLFHIRAEVLVKHDDRDVEFHDLGDLVRAWWGPGTPDLGTSSCELLARRLAGHLTNRGLVVVCVEVSEDGECGARLVWDDRTGKHKR